jgi:glucan biosynthesis protein
MKVKFANVQKMEGDRWRVGILLSPKKEGGKLSDVGPAEMRCSLKKGEDHLTETWVYRIQP